MFKFNYCDSELKTKIENLGEHYPEEVCQELPQFLEALKRDGEVKYSDHFRGNLSKISGNSFELHYIVNISSKTIKIIELKVKSLSLLKSRFSLENSWDDSDVIEVIPQCDPPQKLIQALKLIWKGTVEAYDLGYELGHRGKKNKYIARHGQYTRQALESLKLVTSQKQGRKLIPELTERGKLIAEETNEQLQIKLLTIAMLNYQPVWKVIGAITEGEEEFDDLTIQKLIFHEEDREANTCPRRTQTLKSWIKWISSTSGIPIRLPGGTKQLTLPLLYSEENISEE